MGNRFRLGAIYKIHDLWVGDCIVIRDYPVQRKRINKQSIKIINRQHVSGYKEYKNSACKDSGI